MKVRQTVLMVLLLPLGFLLAVGIHAVYDMSRPQLSPAMKDFMDAADEYEKAREERSAP